jgi:hypothetical protein
VKLVEDLADQLEAGFAVDLKLDELFRVSTLSDLLLGETLI